MTTANSEGIVESTLKAPYARVIVPDTESGTFTGRIAEFPGCVAEGDTLEQAHRNLEQAAKSWLRATLDLGQEIPGPFEERTFSGRVLVRFPASIHRRATEMAERENTSLNQFIVSAVSERVGETQVAQRLIERVEERILVSDLSRRTSVHPTPVKTSG
jgi:predicted RNase H-like HicB family nuclease